MSAQSTSIDATSLNRPPETKMFVLNVHAVVRGMMNLRKLDVFRTYQTDSGRARVGLKGVYYTPGRRIIYSMADVLENVLLLPFSTYKHVEEFKRPVL